MRSRFQHLRAQTWQMEDDRRKLALMEEAIRIADLHLTREDAYEARMSYSSAAIECGCGERMFISFAWCLAEFDRDPGAHDAHTILWHYKWVLNNVWRLPQLPLAKIEAIFEDFKSRCERYDYSLRPYYQQKVNYSLAQGRAEEAAEYYKLWRKARRDGLSDCSACEQNLFGRYYFSLRQLKKGLQVLKPILEGRMSCRSVPQNTYGRIVLPLLALGEEEQAKKIAAKAARIIEKPMYLGECGEFLEYYAVVDMNKAVRLYERTIRWGLEEKMPWDRFLYLVSARLFMETWSRSRRRKQLAESDRVSLAWLQQETDALAAAFDGRNGTDAAHRLIAEKRQQLERLLAQRGK